MAADERAHKGAAPLPTPRDPTSTATKLAVRGSYPVVILLGIAVYAGSGLLGMSVVAASYLAVHHSPHRLYWLNVGRFHPAEKAVQYCVDVLPFVLMGVGDDVLAAYFVFYALNGFCQH